MTNGRGLNVSEQFRHFGEAHEKVQEDFECSRLRWEKEKSLLLQEIRTVQASFDSQTKISENFQTQLWICNRALAHEESSIKEYKSRFDDVLFECREARMTIGKRDEEVAILRDVLGEKDLLLKEMGYKMQRLELENKNLKENGKEFQESEVRNCGSTSPVKKRQKKCTQLEQEHKCGEKLKVDVGLQQRLALQETLMAEKQVESDVMRRDLLKLEDEVSGLCEKVKDEVLLKSTQRVEELEDLLRVNKLETENLVKLFGDERKHLEKEVSGLCERVKVNNESMLKSTERVKELEDLLRVNKLETENLMMRFGDERTDLENKVSGLCEEVKVKDELLLTSTEQAEELENLVRISKLETGHLMKQFGDKKTRLENEVSGLCDKVKVYDQSLLKSTQRVEELEDLVRVNKLEIGNLIKRFGDERTHLENEVSGLHEQVKVKDEGLLKSTQRAEELEDLLRINKLETENLMIQFGDEKARLENEVSGLREKVKVNDESMLKSYQRVEELEDLLRVIKLEIENLMTLFGDEKTRLENEASGLREKVKVKDEAILNSNQRVIELEDLLCVNNLETENLIKRFGDERAHLEKEVVKELEDLLCKKLGTENLIKRFGDERTHFEKEISGLCDKLKIKDEVLSKSIQRAEELEDLLRINRLETENATKYFGDEKTRLENEYSGLCEKVKVNDESMLKSTQRVKEVEDLLRVNKLEIENLILRFGDERTHLENEVSCLSEKVKIKNELLLTSTQHAEELVNLVRISRLETENLMKQFEHEKTRLENEVSDLCEKVKVNDKSLLKSTQCVEELEDLLRVNQVEIGNLMKRFGDERMRLENQVPALYEKVKVKDALLLKCTQRVEELEDLVRISRLETENLMKQFGEEKTHLENEASGLGEKVKVNDKSLLKSTQRVKELEDERMHLEKEVVKELEDLLCVKKLETENLIKRFGDERMHLAKQVSALCENVKVKDALLLKSSQQAEELEYLLRISRLETENLKK